MPAARHSVPADEIRIGAGVDDVPDMSWLVSLFTAARTLSDICSDPAFTRMAPVGPICTAMFPPAPRSCRRLCGPTLDNFEIFAGALTLRC